MHFTYTKPKRGSDLQQGDILQRTKQLEKIIRETHPYYLKSDYTHFMVITQTCDMVKREDGYGTPYIAISPVRPLATVIRRETEKYKVNPVSKKADIVSDRHRARIVYFVQNLLNNNNPEYFYLHEQVPGGLADRSCVFLRLAISFKLLHYDTLRKARILRLRPEFQAKLGWLVGNIYSRVGTEDWVPTQLPEAEWNELIQKIINEHVVIKNDKKIEYVKRHNPPEVVEAWTLEEARAQVDRSPEFKKRDEIIEIVTNELVEAQILSPEIAERARLELKQSPRLKARLPN